MFFFILVLIRFNILFNFVKSSDNPTVESLIILLNSVWTFLFSYLLIILFIFLKKSISSGSEEFNISSNFVLSFFNKSINIFIVFIKKFTFELISSISSRKMFLVQRILFIVFLLKKNYPILDEYIYS